jgi:hypothetical protein
MSRMMKWNFKVSDRVVEGDRKCRKTKPSRVVSESGRMTSSKLSSPFVCFGDSLLSVNLTCFYVSSRHLKPFVKSMSSLDCDSQLIFSSLWTFFGSDYRQTEAPRCTRNRLSRQARRMSALFRPDECVIQFNAN